MDRRRLLWGVVALLAVVNLGLIGSVFYPFTLAEPDVDGVGDELVLASDPPSAYDGQFELTVDGERREFVSATVDGERAYARSYIWQVDTTIESYRESDVERAYARYTSGEHDHAELIDSLRLHDETILRNETDGERTVVLTAVPEKNVSRAASSQFDHRTSPLWITSYRHVRTEDGVEVYEPENGWFEGSTSYRVTNASGQVRVDAETDEVLGADVTLDLTTGVTSYVEYLRERDDTRTVSVTFDATERTQAFEPPEWVTTARQAADDGGSR